MLKCNSEAFPDHPFKTSDNHSPVLCIPFKLLCSSLKCVNTIKYTIYLLVYLLSAAASHQYTHTT